MLKKFQVFISCEHGGNRVPQKYRHLFAGFESLLETHRGYDIGILPFAESLAAELETPLISADVTRLLVDLNRSRRSRTLFSELSRSLPAAEKKDILALYHDPYWRAVEDIAAGIIASGHVALHLSIHSFTPILSGRVRQADIGLLYDPKRPAEKSFSLAWQKMLLQALPPLRVRRNYPYRGDADALVTALRKKFPADGYLGLELEINQRHPLENGSTWRLIRNKIKETLRDLLVSHNPSG